MFRGSDVSLFDKVVEQIDLQGGSVEVLDKNYRTTEDTLEAINTLFSRLSSQFVTMLPVKNLDRHPTVKPIQWLNTEISDSSVDGSKTDKKKQQSVDYQKLVGWIDHLLAVDPQSSIGVLSRKNKGIYELHRLLPEIYDSTLTGSQPTYKNLHLKTYLHLLRSCIFKFVFPFDLHLKELLSQNKSFRKIDFDESEALDSFHSVGCYGLMDYYLSCFADFPYADYLKLVSVVDDLNSAAIQGKSLLSRIYEYQFDERSIPQPSLKKSRIEMMSIHRSKGLQFDHVILLGCDESLRPPPPKALSFSEKGMMALPKVEKPCFQKYPPFFLDEFKMESREMKARELDRLFYVALTRAKKSITFVGSKQYEKNSWFGKMESVDMLPFNKEIEPQYLEGSKYLENLHSENKMTDKKALNDKLELPFRGMESHHGYSFVSTTQVARERARSVENSNEKGTSLLQLDLKQPLDLNKPKSFKVKPRRGLTKSLDSIQMGLNFHKSMELWGSEAYSDWIASLDAKEAELINEQVEFLLSIKEPPISNLLLDGQREWAFSMEQEGQLISGSVDLWGVVDNEIWIVDYKTGLIKEEGFHQLQIYKEAIKKLQLNLPIKMCLISTAAKDVRIKV